MFKKDSEQMDPTEPVLRYKNVHYPDNISSESNHTPLSLKCLKNNSPGTEKNCDQPRPISCPVCAKILAMNSILVHFYFDHPKVLKLRLPCLKRQHFKIKASDLSFETKCFAVIFLEEESSTGNNILSPSNNLRPLLLLGAKLNMELSTRNNIVVPEKKRIEEKLNLSRLQFDKNYLLLFWICKIDNHELISNVKLARRDKKLSFSYTGEAIHIREKQDAKNVYQHAECLIIRGEVINNLLDKDDQMHVFVRCLR